jgi:hypothetical protein
MAVELAVQTQKEPDPSAWLSYRLKPALLDVADFAVDEHYF